MMAIYIATQQPIEKMCDILRKYKTGVEVQHFCNPSRLDNYEDYIESIKDCISDTDRRSLHAPFFDLHPASMDNKVRGVALDRFIKAYNIAIELEVKNIVFHTGYSFCFKPDNHTIKRFGEFWNTFLNQRDESI